MGGDIETIKERLGIAEVVEGYVKLAKAGSSFKGRCPFHNEKTPSFFVSPLRGSYYCFGCGAKGDIFTFVEEMEGLSFKEALKNLAERAGVELKGAPSREAKSERERLKDVLVVASEFFVTKLGEHEEARNYLLSRGIGAPTITAWKLGYAPAEWRALYTHLLALGFTKEVLLKAGLAKPVTGAAKEPYDVFRDRLIFPLWDSNGDVVAFSGRALAKETEPKYLNTPETVLFAKHELLYGLDKAKGEIRKKNYTVLVEGQIDLVLSHQAGITNTVASSGTAFTAAHLERLKKLSQRIILAFDGDKAGEAAAEKAAILALSLGLEVKIARLPEGSDPADVIKRDSEAWKEILRHAKPAPEHFLDLILEREKDRRKAGKAIEGKLLPVIALLGSAIERSHFVSLIASRTGVKEEMVWEDLRRTKKPGTSSSGPVSPITPVSPIVSQSKREKIEERLTEVRTWLAELRGSSAPETEVESLEKEEKELLSHLRGEELKDELIHLSVALAQSETSKDEEGVTELTKKIQELHQELRKVEEGKKTL